MKAVVVGMGPMGKRHIKAIELVNGLELGAVCDKKQAALEDFQHNKNVSSYNDYNEMFQKETCDIMIVATNAPSHHDIVISAINSGIKRILCEKPLACSIAEAKSMINAARSMNVSLAVNHNKRHIPTYQWLAQQLQSGVFGKIRSIRTSCRGIGLGCLGVHFFDQMRFFAADDFVSITGWIDNEKGANPRGSQFHDPGGLVVMEGNSGIRYVHHQIEDAAGPEHIIIDLTKGRIRIEEQLNLVEIIQRDFSVRPGPGRPPKFDKIEVPKEHIFNLSVIDLSAEILRELASDKEKLTCDAEHGLKSLEVVIAAYISNNNGHDPVILPLQNTADLDFYIPIT